MADFSETMEMKRHWKNVEGAKGGKKLQVKIQYI